MTSAFTTVNEQARVDALTGLANRRAWEEALDEAMQGVESGAMPQVTVIAADLDGLKQVNDTFGHEAGDTLIQAMAQVLLDAVPDTLAVTRIGGDEYGVVLVQWPHQPSPEEILARIRAAMAAHPGVQGKALSASLGAASCPPEPTVRDAARLADTRGSADKKDRRVARE